MKSLIQKLKNFFSLGGIFNGYKSILAYLGINLTEGQFLAVEALKEAISNPNLASISNAVFQIALAWGLTHRLFKNIDG
jgi:flagellar biosynthesis protein FlhB